MESGLKVAVPVFEVRVIKTQVQYQQWREGLGKEEEETEKWARAHL